MRNVQMLRMEPDFLSIPLEQAMYCSMCNAVNNSPNVRCGGCGCEALSRVVVPPSGPPDGPGPGPAPALGVLRFPEFEELRRAA